MVIKINYTSSDIYVSTNVSPVYVVVNYSAVNNGGGGAIWGGITGTLSDQTDLQDALDDKVPYTGATANVNLGEFELKAGQLTLDVSPTGTAAVGTTRWNDTIGSSETTLKGGSVILKNGVDLVARVVNKVSPNTTLTKAAYQAVRVSGAQGQRLAVAFAQANNDANSADTIGLVCETIATNQEGFIITVGQLENINTTGSLQGETWVDGDVLYLSPTTAGAITKVKPTGNGHIVVIGYVEYAHANNGKIYVKVMNGWELDELHDVSIVTPANNEALIYESATALWKNKTIASALGYTPISGTGVSGQVAYWNGTSSQTGSNNLFWNSANNRLGINTNTPTSALQVVGTAKATNVGTPLVFSEGSDDLTLATQGGSPALSIKATTRNVQIYTGTQPGDSTQRLQVYGDAFIKGSGNTSATNALLVQDSTGQAYFAVRNDGQVGTVSQSKYVGYTINLTGGTTVADNFLTVNTSSSAISGVTNSIRTTVSFIPTSGTGILNGILSQPTINQTGGASGITRGLLVSPVLTAAADWRSIEWSNNSGWGLYGAGTANNYLGGRLLIKTSTIGTFDLDVNGTARVLGASTFARITATTSGIELDYNSGILYHAGGSGSYYQYIDGTGYTFRSRTATGALIFATQDISRMRLTSAGNLLIGTATDIATSILTLDSATKGFLPPRMTTTQKNAISTPAAGLVVYDIDTNKLCCYNGTSWNDLF